MNAVAKIEPKQPIRSVIVAMADRYEMEPAAFEATVRATVCKGSVSREEFAAFLLVAKEHRLNPLTKEIYAFPAKGGGIQPIVSIDGWSRIINEHPAFDGMEFEDERDDGKLVAITCRMYRKDRSHPVAATEYMVECARSTDVWRTWPRRMLRHKAMIQAARYAFGFSGIVDPDEYERITVVHQPERPNLRQRLTGPGAEGFTSSQTEPHDPDTGEIIDEPAPEIEAEIEPDPDAPTVDVLAWAQTLEEGLPYFSGIDELRADWEVHKAALKAADPERHRALNLAIAKRAQEIAEAGATGE